VSHHIVQSINQPELNRYTTWGTNGSIFANSSMVGSNPIGIFVNINNTVYVPDSTLNRIQIWLEGAVNPTKTISGNFTWPIGIFVKNNYDMYIGNDNFVNGHVHNWILNTTNSTMIMYIK
jgi:hypothetical protein